MMAQTIREYFAEHWTDDVEVKIAGWRDDLATATIRGSYSPGDFLLMEEALRIHHSLTICEIVAAGVGVFSLVIDRVESEVHNDDQ